MIDMGESKPASRTMTNRGSACDHRPQSGRQQKSSSTAWQRWLAGRRGKRLGPVGILAGILAGLLIGPWTYWSDSAHAQSARGVAAYDGMPVSDDHGFIRMPGTAVPGHLRSSFTLHNELTFGEFADVRSGGRRLIVRDRVDLLAQLGLGERLAVAIGVPTVLYQQAEDDVPHALPDQVLLDPQLQARYRMFGAAANDLGQRTDGPGLALAGTLHLPLGAEQAYGSEGAARADLSAIADFQVLGAGVAAQLGLRHRFAHYNLGELRMRDALTFGLALKLPMPFWPPLSLLTELRGATEFTSGATRPLTWLFGARVQVGDWTAFATVGAGLRGELASPDATTSLGIRFSPAPADSDGDGTVDSRDECPFLPEDLDGFEDDDGCEDPDNDNDLIPDADDVCPNDEALEGQDADEDGCTDAPTTAATPG